MKANRQHAAVNWINEALVEKKMVVTAYVDAVSGHLIRTIQSQASHFTPKHFECFGNSKH